MIKLLNHNSMKFFTSQVGSQSFPGREGLPQDRSHTFPVHVGAVDPQENIYENLSHSVPEEKLPNTTSARERERPTCSIQKETPLSNRSRVRLVSAISEFPTQKGTPLHKGAQDKLVSAMSEFQSARYLRIAQ